MRTTMLQKPKTVNELCVQMVVCFLNEAEEHSSQQLKCMFSTAKISRFSQFERAVN